jgi:hypothetical protein
MSRQQKKNPNTALLALTTAALALPGISPMSRAATAPTETLLSYRYSNYQESDVPSGRVVLGSEERYNIAVQQFRLFTPIGSSFSLDATFQHEVLSGASPWSSVDPNGDGSTELVMSGASIKDERYDTGIGVSYYYDEGRVGLFYNNSTEDDYFSNSIGADWEREFNDKQTTFNIGFSVADDLIDPEDNIKHENMINPVVGSEDKNSYSIYVGLGQIIDKTRLVQSGFSFSRISGYLTDPYKLIDTRPTSREQFTWTVRYRSFIKSLNSALHLDYRLYRDTWSIISHTIRFSWYKNLTNRWQLVPFVRYYSQTAASFYVPVDNAASAANYFSSDSRLSEFGALSGGLKVVKDFRNWSLIVSGEYYVQSSSYSLPSLASSLSELGASNDPEHPGLIQYTLFTFGFDYKFN